MADLLATTAPALSTTSDIPASVEPTPAPAAQPEPEADETEIVDAGTEAETAEDAPKKPKKTGISERMSELTTARKLAEEQRRAADERADKLAESLREALAAINKVAEDKTKPDPVVDVRPKRDAFDSPDAYDEALIEWSSRQAGRAAAAELERRMAEQKQTEETARTRKQQEEAQAAVIKTWQEKVEDFSKTTDDFEAVVMADNLRITQVMSDAFMAAENGPELAYHLGKNPKEAARIADLPPIKQIYEIGKLSAQLSRPKSNVSRAPDPIKPSGARGDAGPKSPEQESGDEYFARRSEELRQARQR